VKAVAALVLVAFCGWIPTGALAASGETIHSFVMHAAFFSLETHQPQLVDPNVFVAASGAAAGTGPQDIVHVAGVRPALPTDDAAIDARAADGRPLGFTLGTWFGARGTIVVDMSLPNSPRIRATFNGLQPGGMYSLFEPHFAASGITVTPLDGFGTNNSFHADTQGRADITVTLRGALTHANAVVLVYHSDGVSHGSDRGRPGFYAHDQLIYRPA